MLSLKDSDSLVRERSDRRGCDLLCGNAKLIPSKQYTPPGQPGGPGAADKNRFRMGLGPRSGPVGRGQRTKRTTSEVRKYQSFFHC